MNKLIRTLMSWLACILVLLPCVYQILSVNHSMAEARLLERGPLSRPGISAVTGQGIRQESTAPTISVVFASALFSFSGPSQDCFDPIRFADQADVVLVAKLQSKSLQKHSIQDGIGRGKAAQAYVGTFKVERIYKGVTTSIGVVGVQYRTSSSLFDADYAAPIAGVSALYFLKTGTNGQFYFYSPSIPAFPVLSMRPPIAEGTSVKRAIKAELIQNILQGPLPLAQESFDVLWTSPEGVDIAWHIARDPGRPWGLRSEATAYLMRSRDPGALEFAIELMEAARKDTRINFEMSVKSAIGTLYYQRGLSGSQVRRLLALKDTGVNGSLSMLFADSHDPKYAPAAIELLKSDLDRNTLLHIYTYLSELGPVPVPYGSDFYSARSKYIAQYLKWWEEAGKQKYGGSD